jgi:hypothetical protein
MRSIRNFKIDLRIAPANIYLAGIHWQVAQASSLENIIFYMRYNSDTPGNTQQVGTQSMTLTGTRYSHGSPRVSTWKTAQGVS